MEQKMQLVDNKNKYKIFIPKEVELKIKRFLERIYNIEWSGILFYDYEGTLNEGLTIKCKDILLMDKGSYTYTTFEINEEILPYMIDHDLLQCKYSLIHSHCDFGCTFSSTDINTLEERGSLHNNFVSLIVNNKGEYNAAITWKEEAEVCSHPILFDNKPEEGIKNKVTLLRYSYMTIEREVDTICKEIDERINVIIEKANAKIKILPPSNIDTFQPELPFPKENCELPEFEYGYEDYTNSVPEIKISNTIAQSAAAQLLSMNMLAEKIPSQNNIDTAINLINKNLAKRFPNYDKKEEDYMDCLAQFADSVLTSLALLVKKENPEYIDRFDIEEAICIEVMKILNPLKSKCPHIANIEEVITDNYNL